MLNYYHKKEGYDYKTSAYSDYDYEKEILLEEDADDLQAFDYEEQSDLIVIAHYSKIQTTQYNDFRNNATISPQKQNNSTFKSIKDSGVPSPQQFKISWQQEVEINASKQESEPLKTKSLQEDYDSINQVVNEIENNLNLNNLDSNDDKNEDTALNIDEMNEDDQNALINDIESMIKYDEDDDDEIGILDRV